MWPKWFRRSYLSVEERENIREHRADGLRRVVRVLFIIIFVMVIVLVSMFIPKPINELHALKQESEQAKKELQLARQKEVEAYNRLIWMGDSEYVENLVRELIGFAKVGEFVIRPPKEAEPPIPKEPEPSEQ